MSEILKSREEKIQFIEQNMELFDQVPLPVKHSFAPGVCIREVFMPGGSYIIGHSHKTEHFNIMIAGVLLLQMSDGEFTELRAPLMFVSPPGRKIAHIIEDTVWLNVFPTQSQDIDEIEEEFLDKTPVWKAAIENIQKRLTNDSAKNDYQVFLDESGWAEPDVRRISENKDDMTDMPSGSYKVKTGKSTIEGTGLFATADIQPDEIICPARIDSKRTIAGRYTNHSLTPNAKMVLLDNNDMILVALTDIKGCIGGMDGEEIIIDYREALKCQLQP